MPKSQITIRDASGDIIADVLADRFVLVSQDGDKFTKSFSSNDLVDQLGLLEFSRQQVIAESNKRRGL